MHADASNFQAGISKKDAYAQVLEQAKALFDGQRNWVSPNHIHIHLLLISQPFQAFSASPPYFLMTTALLQELSLTEMTRSGKDLSLRTAIYPTTPAKLTDPTQSNLANTASLLWHLYHSLPSPSTSVNWSGFYVLDPSDPTRQRLILGPFQGKVACQTIQFGRGVCGASAAGAKTVLVPDVDEFPGHIACDGDSRSEIVVPIIQNGKVSLDLVHSFS